MSGSTGNIKGWRPNPAWLGALTFVVTAAGLSLFLNGTPASTDVLPYIYGGVAWLSVSSCLGRSSCARR